MNHAVLLISFFVIAVFQMVFTTTNEPDDEEVQIENVESNEESPKILNGEFGKQINDLLKPYVKKLKENQEVVISTGTGFSGDSRFKSGDIIIRKTSGYCL